MHILRGEDGALHKGSSFGGLTCIWSMARRKSTLLHVWALGSHVFLACVLVWRPSLRTGVLSMLAFFSVSACTSIAVLLAYQCLYAVLLAPCITGRIMVGGCLWLCVSACTIIHALSCTVHSYLSVMRWSGF